MFRIFRIKKNEDGQSLVEFALVLPMLLLLVMGIIQFGVILGGYVAVSNSAREGARVGIIEKDNTKVEQKVNQSFDASTLLKNPVVEITFPDGGGYTSGEPVSVKVTGDVPIIVPLMDTFFGGTDYSVSKTAVMMVEGYIDD